MPNAVTPTTINMTFDKYYYSLQLDASISSAKLLLISGCVRFQRCNIDANGLYTNDPSPGAYQTIAFGDLSAFSTANPSLAAMIQNVWNDLNTLADAMNASLRLV